MFNPFRYLCSVLVLMVTFSVNAGEYIQTFNSHIEVQKSGDIYVTETITVMVNHNNIKRGIYRDFPTTYRTALLTKSTVEFEVEEILRNGNPEPYHIEPRSNGNRIYIGNSNVWVPKGEQQYTIQYRTNRQIAFLDDHDLFSWNVTGNDWQFRIDQVKVTVSLPEGVVLSRDDIDVWTGFIGQTGANYSSSFAGNTVQINSTQPLMAHQGVTFNLKIPKGFIVDNSNVLLDFFYDNLMWVLMVLTLLSLLMFYILGWHQVGRDPEAGVIMPLFHPPEELSPAAMRYVLTEDSDHKNFTAALINLAVKGYIKLVKTKKGYQVEKASADVRNNADMSSGEKIIMKRLVNTHFTVKFEKEYNSKVKNTMAEVARQIKKEYQAKCFKDNKMLGYFGIGISALIMIFFMLHLNLFKIDLMVSFAALAFVVGYALYTISGARHGLKDLGSFLFIGYFVFSFFISMGRQIPTEMIVFGLFLVAVNALFIYLLKSPTPFGRELMDKIEGFKLYLSTAEQDRLEIMHPPEMTPKLFEKYLPYAIALGVENKWSQQFANYLRAAGTDNRDSNYSPDWYSGGRFNLSSSSSGFSGLSSGMATSISAAATPPSSSSGGGGGFSGGGGGGGGGGGW